MATLSPPLTAPLERPRPACPIPPEREAEVIAGRARLWAPALGPTNPFESWLVEQIALESVRLDRCQHQESSLRQILAVRAEFCWDDDRRLAAEELGAKLSRRPAEVARKLGRSRAGAEWLIDRWEALGGILDAKGVWTDPQRSLALDLLGVPADLRDGPTPLDLDRPALGARIAAEIDRLRRLKAEALDDLDDLERTAARVGLGPDTDPALARIRRDERAAARRLEWCRSQLLRARPASPEVPACPPPRPAVASLPTFPSTPNLPTARPTPATPLNRRARRAMEKQARHT